MERFNFQVIEKKWQKKSKLILVGYKEEILLQEMFPYPSGRIHMGHQKLYH